MITETFENAWQCDERDRFVESIRRHELRSKHRAAILEADDRSLPDYYRPLLKVKNTKRKGIIKSLFRSLIP